MSNEKKSITRLVRKAPAPIKPVGGGGHYHAPEATCGLSDFPPNYPSSLIPYTEVTIGKARKKFPLRTQMPELCKLVISELAPYFLKLVQARELQADSVLATVDDLLHYLLINNCFYSSENFKMKMKLRISEEWTGLAEKLAQEGPEQGGGLGHRINQLRQECGWSIDILAEKTGMDKKLILSHLNKPTKPHPKTLKEYAQAFTKGLGRAITVSDLKK